MVPGYSSGFTVTFRLRQAEQMRRLPTVATGVFIGRPRVAGGTSRSRPQALQYTQASLPSRSMSLRVTGLGALVIMRLRTKGQHAPFIWTCSAPASLSASALQRARGRRAGSTGTAARHRSTSHDIPNIAHGRPRSRPKDATKVRQLDRTVVVLGA